ncbi:MAG: hypothetical protein BGN87_19115 [Rhizobiales bacterium 65-79]|jgi:hypothetical protein|nr:hypothetical protein [Hyphomicrobiales bacterium]OJU01940.1 MAG: hypothetical protein BGN87_19115 [Rhizobiales bacterium 65-79]
MSEKQTMSPERFRAMAEAYGGSIRRWPAEPRRQAEPLLSDPRYGRILSEACALDEFLDEWTVAPPSRELAARIRLGAPASIREYFARWRLWLSGIGLAAALAGALAGGVAVAALAPMDSGWPPLTTAFGDLSD